MLPVGFIPEYNGVLGFPSTAEAGRFGYSAAKIYYVSSSHANANSGNSGLDPNYPLPTLAAALDVAAAGDVIYLAAGHNENIGNAQITLDVAGVSIIGLGTGPNRPRFDFDHANASIDITANGVMLKNIMLLPSVTDVLIGIDVNAAVTDTWLEAIESLPGEDGAGTDEFALTVDVKAGCARTSIIGCTFTQHASAAGVLACVRFTGASDLCTVRNCLMWTAGVGLIAPINGLTTLSTRLLIDNCVLVADNEPGVEVLTGTTGVIRNTDIFSDLATIAAATVADGMAHFRVRYVEVGNESDAVVKTASADD